MLLRNDAATAGRSAVTIARCNFTNNASLQRSISNPAAFAGTIAVDGAYIAALAEADFFFNTGTDVEASSGARVFATPAVELVTDTADSAAPAPPLSSLTTADGAASLPSSSDSVFVQLQQARPHRLHMTC